MGYKPNYQTGSKGRSYIAGSRSMEIDTNNKKNRKDIFEERLRAPEREQRININNAICIILSQNITTEEMQSIIEKEFPDVNPNRIKSLIEHWKTQYEKATNEIGKLLEKIKNGEASKAYTESAIQYIYSHYSGIKPLLKRYYLTGLEQLGDEER